MSSDRYRGQSRRNDSSRDDPRGQFDDRYQDAGREGANAAPPEGRDREDEYRRSYEPDKWDMAPRGDFRSQDRPYPESQADGDPSYSRSGGRGEGSQGSRTWSQGSGRRQSPPGSLRGGSERGASFDGLTAVSTRVMTGASLRASGRQEVATASTTSAMRTRRGVRSEWLRPEWLRPE